MTRSPAHGADSDLVREYLPSRRAKEGLAYAEGETLAREALLGSWEVLEVFISDEFSDTSAGAKLSSMARSRSVRTHRTAVKALEKLSAVDTAPPIAVVIRPPAADVAGALASARRILVLDRIADPGNAGTLIRTAVAFGSTALLTKGSVTLSNDKLVRATAGVCFHPRSCMNAGPSAELAPQLVKAGWRTLALDARATQAIQGLAIGADERVAFVVGNESAGVDWSAWGRAERLRIAMTGHVESLNASISGALALYELARADSLGQRP